MIEFSFFNHEGKLISLNAHENPKKFDGRLNKD